MKSGFIGFDMQMSGNPSSPCTLLFSDLFNLFTDSFQNVISQFENWYRILVYTDSGFNSETGDRKLRHNSLSGYADDMIKWLEDNNITRVIYVAHSVNGLLALTAAAKAPHLFEKIIFTSVAPCLFRDPETQYKSGYEADKLDYLFASLIHQNDDFHGKIHQNHAVQLTDILSKAFSELNVQDAQAVFSLLFSVDCRKYLTELKVLTVILQVSSDLVATNEAGYLMYRTIPDCQFIRINAKGQLPQVEAPEEIILAMNFFINSAAC